MGQPGYESLESRRSPRRVAVGVGVAIIAGLLVAANATRSYQGWSFLAEGSVPFSEFIEGLKKVQPLSNSSDWRIGKVAWSIHAGTAMAVQSVLNEFVCAEAGDCPSDLGCGALRAMCDVAVPWSSAWAGDDAASDDEKAAVNTGSSTVGLHFVDAPRLNDHWINGTMGVEFWVQYMESAHEQHSPMQFDVWMHSKHQLYAGNLSALVSRLALANVPTIQRESRDADGARVAHVGFALAGRILELVGPAESLGADWSAQLWSEAECAAAHALVSPLSALSASDSVDDETQFKGEAGLVLVGVATAAADPTAETARPLLRDLRSLMAADVSLLYESEACTVVEVAWPSMQHASLRLVRNALAATGGAYDVADLEDYVQADHASFVSEDVGGWDRFLDQHLGFWYSGTAAESEQLLAELHASLASNAVPYAQRQQTDALLVYAGYGWGAGALAYEFQFANAVSNASSECGCVASNNNDLFLEETGDTCWANTDDWCSR